MSKPLTRLLWTVILTVVMAGCVAIGNFMGIDLDLSPLRSGDSNRPAAPCHVAPGTQGPLVQDAPETPQKETPPPAKGAG